MQNNDFCDNLNSLFSLKAPELRFCDDGLDSCFVVDDSGRKITTFPILEYEERYLSIYDSESYIYLSLCSNGQRTEVVKIKSNMLFNVGTFISKFGNKPFTSFTNSSWDIFFKIIEIMLQEIEQRVIYQYSGWNKALDAYLFGNLMIKANSTNRVESTITMTDTVLSEKSELDICKKVDNIAANLSSNPIVGYICLMYLMLSHCKQRFVQTFRLCPEFVLSLVGQTNSYKTTTSTAFFNTHDASVSSFEDTLASIRRMFQSNKSGVTIIDDYKTSSLANDAKYEKVVRLSGDIQTTGKYVSGNCVVDELITGMSVITGEKRPQLQQSSYSRILFVDLEQNPVNLDQLTILQKCKADMNSFLVLLVKYILEIETFDHSCLSSFQKHREDLLQDESVKGMHGRYFSMYGWLVTMWETYMELLQQKGFTTTFDFKSEIKTYIYAQHCTYDNNPIKLFKIAYVELVNANEIIVTDKDGVDSLNFDVVLQDGEMFLKSNGAYKKIYKFWMDKGIDFSVSERKLRKLLNEAGILKSKNGKLTVEKKTKDNRSYSGYYLYKNYFFEYGAPTEDEKNYNNMED